MVKPIDCGTKKQFRSLWIHEGMRVFHDRLINQEDKTYFTTIMHELLKRSFEETASHKEIFEDQVIMFGDYLRPGYTLADRRYEQVIIPKNPYSQLLNWKKKLKKIKEEVMYVHYTLNIKP
jgi:dynein heavy chain